MLSIVNALHHFVTSTVIVAVFYDCILASVNIFISNSMKYKATAYRWKKLLGHLIISSSADRSVNQNKPHHYQRLQLIIFLPVYR